MLLSLRAINLWFIGLSNIYRPLVLYLLSIHLAGWDVVNLWCIQYMVELYHSIYGPQVLYLLSINLAVRGVVNLWCIQYMIELYYSIYAYNQMRLCTIINDALKVCYQYDIWHIWTTRSTTVNQRTFTSSDHDDYTWCDNNISNSRLREMYIISSADVLFHHLHPACALLCVGSIVYLIHTHRRNRHHHHRHRKHYLYRQLMRCDCSTGVDKFIMIDRYW
jgi:hypothetical protein